MFSNWDPARELHALFRDCNDPPASLHKKRHTPLTHPCTALSVHDREHMSEDSTGVSSPQQCGKMAVTESKTELYDMDTCADATSPAEEKPGSHRLAEIFESYIQPCVAELLGSALFIFVGCSSVIENVEGTGRLQPALAHGLALAIVIALFGEIR